MCYYILYVNIDFLVMVYFRVSMTDLVTFTEETLNGKLHFLCIDSSHISSYLSHLVKNIVTSVGSGGNGSIEVLVAFQRSTTELFAKLISG